VGRVGKNDGPECIKPKTVTRQEIEQKMDELAWEYYYTHDPEIPEEYFRTS
jgi:hypothetical protein